MNVDYILVSILHTIGGSPDRIMTYSCCKSACLEIKCPYSINHLSPDDPEAKLPYLKKQDNKLVC